MLKVYWRKEYEIDNSFVFIASLSSFGIESVGFDEGALLVEIYPLIERVSIVTGFDQTQVIPEVFGEVKFVYQKTDFQGYYCWSWLWCYGAINPLEVDRAEGLLIHELGHRFLNDLELTYADLEMNLGYWEDGTYIHVTGINPLTGQFERTPRGYPHPGTPCEQHGRISSDYNTYQEDFADMFMNWARDTFSDDRAGCLRRAWKTAFVREHAPRKTSIRRCKRHPVR